MDGTHLEWTTGETIFAAAAVLIVAMSTFGFDNFLFRSRNRKTQPPDPRNYHIGYIVEGDDVTGKEKEREKQK